MSIELRQGDCLDEMRKMQPRSVQLCFCSPPYVDCRTYGIDFKLKGQAYVDWAKERFMECLRVTDGLVAWVIEGKTSKFRWDATPVLLMADLHRAGAHLRKPPIYKRDGIPGSGGPDWLANKYEFIVCATNSGKLPWSANSEMGSPPKYGPGGACSHRMKNGRRVNGKMTYDITGTDGYRNGDTVVKKIAYAPPERANPGNIIDCGAVGGGHLGCGIAHNNEAPFPESLVAFFIRSFCPPGGTVLDPFSGSGTTCAVALKNGRNGIGIDIRQSQIELAQKRLSGITPPLFGATA